MHFLTKLFIVIVSLLAIALVPLVVVYTFNENSYEAMYLDAKASEAAQGAMLEQAEASFNATNIRKEAQLQEKADEIRQLQANLNSRERELRRIESQLADADSRQNSIEADISTLSTAVSANQVLTESLIDELRGLRGEVLLAERQKVELDEALRDSRAQLDVAVQARRAVQEELQRLKDEQAVAMDKISRYLARYGDIGEDSTAMVGAIADANLDATIVQVGRTSDETLAEINVGSRDGVKVGWVVPIGYRGRFIARLRITHVDINRSTGVVEMEDPDTRGKVEIGHRVMIRAGR